MVDYPEAQIKIPYRIGIAYLSMSDNPNATRYFYLSKKQAETLNDSINQAKALSGLALVMFNLNKWDEAIKNLKSIQKINTKEYKSMVLNSGLFARRMLLSKRRIGKS
jgi:tetratricopeptide (TPR) repeat protein